MGDAFGERFFVHPAVAEQLIEQRAIPASPWNYTDDTEMALGIFDVLESHGGIDPDRLAERFAQRYQADPQRGYGGAAHGILRAIGMGFPWQKASSSVFSGEGSLGNGGGMRSAPIGAYFADDIDQVIEHARRSAVVTHYHPEGQAGAIAIALGAAYTCQRSLGGVSVGSDLLSFVSEHMPHGATRDGIEYARTMLKDASVALAAEALGTGELVTAPDTIPFALWCAHHHLDSFEDAMWATVSGLGDRDTTCAMVGGIVVMSVGVEGIPESWREAREPLQFQSMGGRER